MYLFEVLKIYIDIENFLQICSKNANKTNLLDLFEISVKIFTSNDFLLKFLKPPSPPPSSDALYKPFALVNLLPQTSHHSSGPRTLSTYRIGSYVQ